MSRGRRGSETAGLTRRGFLVLAGAGVVTGGGLARARAGPPRRSRSADEATPMSGTERLHVPDLRLPIVTINGAKVPIVVAMGHPMTPDHYVTRLEVVNARDPVPSKGIFEFTPASGRVYVAFQARMHDGPSEVAASAACIRDGVWTARRSINVQPGGGGCAAPAPEAEGVRRAAIAPPELRIPELVTHGRIERGQVIHVQLKMRHPNRTGLAFRDGTFVRESDPFHLETLEVLYGAERVSRFRLTSALSDDPFITFTVRALREEAVRVLLTNNRGGRFEAAHPIRLA